MQYVSQKFLKLLAWKSVVISKVYPAYRKWFNSKTNKPETFKLVDWVLKEEKWVDGQRVLENREPSFKDHKKVYDIVLELESEDYLKVTQYDKESQSNREVELYDKEFTFKEVWASKIRWMAEATVAFWKVPTKDDWTPAYDWEDSFIDELSWTLITFSTKNVKKKIWDKDVEFAEFTFKEWRSTPKSKSLDVDTSDILPF